MENSIYRRFFILWNDKYFFLDKIAGFNRGLLSHYLIRLWFYQIRELNFPYRSPEKQVMVIFFLQKLLVLRILFKISQEFVLWIP
jgi:hypothetical protein